MTPSQLMSLTNYLWKIIIFNAILFHVGSSQHLSEVRLVNGTSPLSGMVEILDGARSLWLGVCHTPTWSIMDVQVICRQLGYAGPSRAFTVEEPNPDRPVSYYDQQFSCRGGEREINDCIRAPIDTSTLEACVPAWASCHDEHYLGCYRDNEQDRVLSAAMYPLTNRMSPQICMTYCLELGHAFAGVSDASKCFCGSTARTDLTRQKRYEDIHCHVTCAGNPRESCGGVQKLAVFRTVIDPITTPATTEVTTVATVPATTVAITTPAATTATPRKGSGTTSIIRQPENRTPPLVTMRQTVTLTTTVIQYPGQRVSMSAISGLAASGGVLFLVCSGILLFVAFIYRRRQKKGCVKEDLSSYPLSGSVEIVVDSTYLDPMNSIGDSAVYSGVSQVSESEFDSTFGGGEGAGEERFPRGDFSAYLGLSFREMQRRHDDEYALLNAGLKNDGSFATTKSGDVAEEAREGSTCSDASGFEGSNNTADEVDVLPVHALGCPNDIKTRPRHAEPGHGLYDEPHKSGIYISGTGLCPFKRDFEFDTNTYSPVHQGSYCEVGGGATPEEPVQEPPVPVKLRDKRGLIKSPASREYASIFPGLTQIDFGANQFVPKAGKRQIGIRLESGEYATVSDVDRACCRTNDHREDKPSHVHTLPATARISTEAQLRLGNSRNGDYDSVYFEGRKQSKTLPDSRRKFRIESVPFPSVLYSDYATIGDESEMHLRYTLTNNDTFETEDVVKNMDHSYSSVDHKKSLIGQDKKCSVKDISLSSDGSITSPSYENIQGKDKKSNTGPRMSMTSILSHISPRGHHLRKYSSLDGEIKKKDIQPGKRGFNQNRAPSATIPRGVRPSEVQYAVVDKALRNSEPALLAKRLTQMDDSDYDVLQHTT